MVQPSPAITTKGHCRHCGGTLFWPDDDNRLYCAMCRRPYRTWRDYGRIGGLQTALRYGRDYMAEIGRRGGLAGRLPTMAEVRQQSASETQIQIREGRLPNRLSELKELWKLRNKEEGAR